MMRNETEANRMREGEAAEKVKKPESKRYFDYGLLFTVLILLCFGLMMVYDTSYYTAQIKGLKSTYYFMRSAKIYAGGVVVMLIVAKAFDYRKVGFLYAWLTLITAIVSMVLVNFTSFGVESHGKKRWFGIHGHSIFQPAELVKLMVILCLAYFLTRYVGRKSMRMRLFVLGCIMCIPILLVAMNNLSSGLILAGMMFIILYVGCERKRIFLLLVVLGVAGIAFILLFGDKMAEKGILIKSYQMSRINTWRNPLDSAESGAYQVLHGLYAIGAGGLFGKGLGTSTQKLGYLPEASNDMVFSVICEEMGIFGAFCVIALYAYLLYRILVIARNANNRFGFLICVGVFVQIALQVVLNIAVVTNSIPNTGVSLPFISNGGTSAVFLLIEIGLVLNVSGKIRLKE